MLPMPLRFNFQLGQTLTEYSLIGACVLIFSIFGLAGMGVKLENLFGASNGNISQNNTLKILQPASAQNKGPDQKFQVNNMKMPVIEASQSIHMALSDGTKLRMLVPDDIPQSIQTVGANGTTELLAMGLTDLAKQLLEEGKITATGSDAIIALANWAHDQAKIANVIESTMKNCACDMNTTVQYNGQTYKLADLAKMINTGSATPGGQYTYGPETDKFWDVYGKLWPAGVMQDPTTAAIIDSYIHEIAVLSDTHLGVLEKISPESGVGSFNYQRAMADYVQNIGLTSTAELLQSKTGAEVTHTDAAGICKTGDNRDSGVKCSR